ncbi:lytic transglycosylase domain-containing protein [Sporosarcina sp. G11-34]|uniref:lytic transglycosylase domain-containing protein n=1 Tax=Sporosarcina sp. G11-34 TaxID=2849605 RepID=UPI003FA6B0AE
MLNLSGVKDSFDSVKNIKVHSKYLRKMLNELTSNVEHTLATYNAGPENPRIYNDISTFKET